MEENRCPMCGRENPADLEVCQFCQARLKPLVISSPPDDEPSQEPGQPTSPEQAAESEPVIVDWLRDLREEEQADSAPTEDLEAGEEEIQPDWLETVRLGGDADEERDLPGEDDSGAIEAEGVEEEPEWLERIRKEEEVQPEWLETVRLEGDAGEGRDLPGEEASEEVETEAVEEEPEWLERIRNRQEEEWIQGEAAEGAIPSFEDSLAADAAGLEELAAPGEELPDWLASMAPEESMDIPEEETSFPEAEVPSSEVGYEWLLESPSEEEAAPTETTVEAAGPVEELSSGPARAAEPVEERDVPDWLADFRPDESPEVEVPEFEDTQAEGELSPAQLPVWLEAIRPVEAVAPSPPTVDDTEKKVENTGPLAGLRGVLPAEMELLLPEKRQAHPAKIQVTENQRKYVDLLRSVLEEEGKPRSLPGKKPLSPQRPLRWIITLLLFGSILWTLIAGSNPASLPPIPPETMAVNRLVSGLPAEAKVLLAFDYDPGLSPEMDGAAAAVVDHIMLRGAHLALISTRQAGPLLGERFIRDIQAGHRYVKNEHYVNLGFIPGGAAGLLSFAASPARTVPFTLDSLAAWESGERQPLRPLQGVHSLADFSMLVVIVDQADLARVWIEQAGPYLERADGQTPMVMVISAQAEPLVRPYYQGNPRQIQGLVTGLRGGAGYASLTGRESLPSAYWPAFGTGLAVAAVLILASGIFNLSSGLTAKRKDTGEEEG